MAGHGTDKVDSVFLFEGEMGRSPVSIWVDVVGSTSTAYSMIRVKTHVRYYTGRGVQRTWRVVCVLSRARLPYLRLYGRVCFEGTRVLLSTEPLLRVSEELGSRTHVLFTSWIT